MSECTVFGLPDDRYGEIVGVVYLPHEGKDLTEDQLAAFLETKLPPHKRPAKIWRAGKTLPRLGTQKIDRKLLREQYTKVYTSA